MKRLALLLLLVACSKDSTGPAGLDPIVLARNNQGTVPATLTWWDQSGQSKTSVLPAFGALCAKFTSTTLADSVRFEIVVGDTTGANGSWSKQWSPWFDPKTGVTSAASGSYPDGAEFWTLDVASTTDILMRTVKSAPC